MKLQTILIGLVGVAAALWSAAAVAAPNATAPDIRQTDPRAAGLNFTTDTLGGNGAPAAAGGYVIITDTLGGNGHAAAAPGYRFVTDTLGGNGVRRTSPQDVLVAVKRLSPNQVGLAWQYLRDTGQIAPSSAQKILDAVERTSPNQVGLAWQYLRDTGQITTPKTPSARGRLDDRVRASGIDRGAAVNVNSPTPFDWSDAGTGAAVAVGLMMLLAGAALSQRSRRRTRLSA
jgi:hypothetical protein